MVLLVLHTQSYRSKLCLSVVYFCIFPSIDEIRPCLGRCSYYGYLAVHVHCINYVCLLAIK